MNELTLKTTTETLSPMAQRLVQVIALCESKICQATLLHLLKACGWGAAATKSGLLTQALLKLDSLRQMVDGTPGASKASSSATGYDERMIWETDVRAYKGHCYGQISPFIQKLSGGEWTKGRPVALERLYQNLSKKEFAFLTDQDRAVCKCIKQSERPGASHGSPATGDDLSLYYARHD